LGHSPGAEEHFEDWSKALGTTDSTRFLVKGKIPFGELSAWLGRADCGLSTTPLNVIEKSGSAVAFAEHGVPVLVTHSGSPTRRGNVPPGTLKPRFWLADEAALARCHELPPRYCGESSLDKVAATLMAYMEEERER
jgi:hypothetical protein